MLYYLIDSPICKTLFIIICAYNLFNLFSVAFFLLFLGSEGSNLALLLRIGDSLSQELQEIVPKSKRNGSSSISINNGNKNGSNAGSRNSAKKNNSNSNNISGYSSIIDKSADEKISDLLSLNNEEINGLKMVYNLNNPSATTTNNTNIDKKNKSKYNHNSFNDSINIGSRDSTKRTSQEEGNKVHSPLSNKSNKNERNTKLVPTTTITLPAVLSHKKEGSVGMGGAVLGGSLSSMSR